VAIVTTPASPYAVGDWLSKPRNAQDGEAYDKYNYKKGESLASIAATVSKPGKKITWQDITNFNWGTGKPSEVNFYLRDHTGCKYETNDGYNYIFSDEDKNPFVWIPRYEKKAPPGKYRSPGWIDVGHVALDDDSKKHINTLVVKPVYTITLELGDLDALFEPVGSGELHKSPGVQQRLQVLGYFYTPLGHSRRSVDCKKVWEYYRRVHTRKPKPAPTNPELLAILKQEVRNNVVAVVKGSLPTSGQILDGRVPMPSTPPRPGEGGAPEIPGKPGEVAMIRLPGGYAYTFPRYTDRRQTKNQWENKGSEWVPKPTSNKNYAWSINSPRHEVEKAYWADNPLLGKIPLVAHVERVKLDGSRAPAEGVSVYFQLVKPDELKAGDPLRAPDLRETVMDYSLDWSTDAGPYEIASRGPKKFLDDALAGQAAVDESDPQKDNVDRDYGGKRRIPVEGEGAGAGAVPGVFEIKTKREGMHTLRDDQHTDYGGMLPAQAVKPVEESTDDGKKVVRHAHAVSAKTNEKGNACVVFTPSQCGGDRYKIRAYIGPETLEFAGDDPDGPVVETGTLVVWRNIRLNRYVQAKVPAKADVGTNVQDLWEDAFPGLAPSAFDQAWTNHDFASGVGNIDISEEGNKEAVCSRNPRTLGASFNERYRPVNHSFIGLAEQYRRCYCEFLADCERKPEAMTRGEYVAALAAARKACKDSGEVSVKVNWNALILDPDADAGDADKVTTPWTFNVRHPDDYNTKRGAGFPALSSAAGHYAEINRAIYNHGLAAFMGHFAGGGVLPGLTIIQMPQGDTWEFLSLGNIVTSGDAGPGARTCCLWYTDGVYRSDGMFYTTTANTIHELGHTLVRPHAPDESTTGGVRADSHQAIADCVCVMSYRGCYGEYCGRCSLALRGWITKGGVKSDGSVNTDGV